MDQKTKRNRRPELVWVPVRDAKGRVHMEAHWELHRVPARRHAA